MSDLPASWVDLLAALGEEAAWAVVEHWGGTRIYVPQRPSAEIIDVLGEQRAAVFCTALGGAAHAIPLALEVGRRVRDMRIRARVDAGDPVSNIAREEGLTTGRIYQILAARPRG